MITDRTRWEIRKYGGQSDLAKKRKDEVLAEMNVKSYSDLVCARPSEPSAFVGKVVWVRAWHWNLLLKRLVELEAK